MELLTRSLTRGMGFRFLMSGMLSMMIRPPPGLQDTEDTEGPDLCPSLTPITRGAGRIPELPMGWEFNSSTGPKPRCVTFI